MELMAGRCYVHNDQQSTVRRFLAAIKLFTTCMQGAICLLGTAMIVAVGKGDQPFACFNAEKGAGQVALTWANLTQGRQVVTSMVDGGKVMWLGLALSYFLLCRVSEL